MRSSSERAALAAAVRAALTASCRGSRTLLLGSLATATDDAYSDIDLEWVVPDGEFERCVREARAVLDGVRAVAEVRADPDLLHSDRRRLLFVRFADVPLFWRLDLSVRAASVARDAAYDLDNPRARARDDEWSRPASALANAVGAVKELARERPGAALGLLERGFARIGEEGSPVGADSSVRVDAIVRLARAAARREPGLAELAEQVVALAHEELRT
ncbi:hypothetical protein ACQB60_13545 [Actinomycetota bacterium Odt1-20B]